ncbi:MAG: LysR family transcriptional regulator [Variovorax paradoxus]|nr:MAG: LysR family transcriptional regulator [Variovorax paradoxus]PZQ05463.1 MAG: LysR family transcriptional regulator [Variovorax paradoxus]
MHIDIKLIEAFVLIMRSGSLSSAEQAAGVPKATLSRQLLKLETTLGVQLLKRTPRRVVATEAGSAFLRHCERLLADFTSGLEAARTEVEDLSEGLSGKLSVLADSEFSTTFATHVSKLFLSRFPNVQCELEIARTPTAAELGRYDCYVCSSAPDLPDTVAKLLGRIAYGLYASPIYLQRHPTLVTPSQLGAHDAITMKAGHGARDKVLLHSEASTFPYIPRSAIATNDYWVMKTFCVDGFGVALLPDFFVQPETTSGSLLPVLPAWKPETRRVYCAYQKQKYMGAKVRAFVDLMASCMADLSTYNSYVASNVFLRSALPVNP